MSLDKRFWTRLVFDMNWADDESFHDAVNLTALWDKSGEFLLIKFHPSRCSSFEGTARIHFPPRLAIPDGLYEILSRYYSPNPLAQKNFITPLPERDSRRDLLISTNYT